MNTRDSEPSTATVTPISLYRPVASTKPTLAACKAALAFVKAFPAVGDIHPLVPYIEKFHNLRLILEKTLQAEEAARPKLGLPTQDQRKQIILSEALSQVRSTHAKELLDHENREQALRTEVNQVQIDVHDAYTKREVDTIENSIDRLRNHWALTDHARIMAEEREDGCCVTCCGFRSARRKAQENKASEILNEGAQTTISAKEETRKAEELIETLKEQQQQLRLKLREEESNQPILRDERLRLDLTSRRAMQERGEDIHYNKLSIHAMNICIQFYQSMEYSDKKISELIKELSQAAVPTQPSAAPTERTPLLVEATPEQIAKTTLLAELTSFQSLLQTHQQSLRKIFKKFYCPESDNGMKFLAFIKNFNEQLNDAQKTRFLANDIDQTLQDIVIPPAPQQVCLLRARR